MRHRKCFWTVVCSAFVALGCSIGCTSMDGVATPKTDRSHEQWPKSWTCVGGLDASPVTVHLLSLIDDERLRRLVDEALRANPDLRVVACRLAAARRLRAETRATREPLVDLAAGVARSNSLVDPSGDAITAMTRQLTVEVAWEVDLWGRLADLDSENAARIASLGAELGAARDALAARIIEGWVVAVGVRRSMSLERERLALLDRQYQTVERRYRRGLAERADLERVGAEVELSRAALTFLAEQARESVRSLELLLGREPRSQLLVVQRLPQIGPVGVGCPVEVLVQRHDVRSAILRLRAASSAAAAAAKAMLPRIRLTGSLTRDLSPLSVLLEGGSLWSALGSLTQPLLQRHVLAARADASQLEVDAAWAEYRSTVLVAIGEVEVGLARGRSLELQFEQLSAALASTTAAASVTELRYRSGLDDVVEMLDARSAVVALQQQVEAIDTAILRNRINLALAVGAGIEEL